MSFENQEKNELFKEEVIKDNGKLEAKFLSEKNGDQETENDLDHERVKYTEEQKEIDKLKDYIDEISPSQETQNPNQEKFLKKRNELTKKLPSYLKSKGSYSFTKKLTQASEIFINFRHLIIRLKEIINPKKNIEGYKNYEEVRKGPFIIIANHTYATEINTLISVLDRIPHVAVGYVANWRVPIKRFVAKAIKGFPVRESFKHVIEGGDERIEDFIKNRYSSERNAYIEVLEKEKNKDEEYLKLIYRESRKSLETMLGLLSNGEAVLFFPEGASLPLVNIYGDRKKPKTGLQKGYNGAFELARAAEKFLGFKIPILPIGISERTKIGKPLYQEDCVKENLKEGEEAGDFLMRKIKELLPESYHGVYRNK